MANTQTSFDFSQYLTFDHMTEALHALAAQYPRLAHLSSIGQSHEGRELWLMTVTNFETGPDTDKPAYWIDANIHAAEVTGSATALYTIQQLLTLYGGADATINHLLDLGLSIFCLATLLTARSVS